MNLKRLNYTNGIKLIFLIGFLLNLSVLLAQPKLNNDDYRNLLHKEKYKSINVNALSGTTKKLMKNEVSPDTTYWKSRGYGYVATKITDTIFLYGYTQVSVVLEDTLLIEDDQLLYKEIPIGKCYNKDTLFVINIGKEILFDKIDTIPDVTYSGKSDNPVVNFEVLWNTFKENCSLFEVTSTNWDSIYTIYKPLVSDTTSNETLFGIFSQMLEPLNDGHSYIYDKDGRQFYTPGPEYIDLYSEETEQFFENIVQRLDDQNYTVLGNNKILYGTINNSTIGYVNIQAMAGYTDFENYEPDGIFIAKVMDQLVDEFTGCKAIIVDVRLNEGGDDLVSFEIASRFNDKTRLGYSRQYRYGGYTDYSELVSRNIEVNNKNFGGKPFIVLTSNQTLSAADAFAMIIKDIPSVTLLGEHTYGIFSDMLGKMLPNGWEFYLSNERYLSSEGINYEQKGIYPDIELALDSADFFNGTDNVLEKAIELLAISDINDLKDTYFSLKAYPNPVNEQTVIQVSLPEGQQGVVKILNMLGEVVAEYQIQGKQTLDWNTGGLSDGTYTIVLNSGLKTDYIRIIKSL